MKRMCRSSVIVLVTGILGGFLAWNLSAVRSQQAPMVSPKLLDLAASGVVLSELTLRTKDAGIHIFPVLALSTKLAALIKAAGPAPGLDYAGGPIMQTVTIYNIFWAPPKLQNSDPTEMTGHYQAIQTRLMQDYPGHGIHNNNTQYYQITGTGAAALKTYIQNIGSFGGSYVDSTTPYPTSAGCAKTKNCLTDTQIRAEIQHVMNLKNWHGGLDKIYFLYTSSGEQSCSDADSTSCSYSQYCAYHSYIPGSGASPPIIYANMSFGDPKYCQDGNVPSPNNDVAADTAASSASHELSEAITDPLINAWYDAQGAEIGDLCAYKYGPNSWGSNNANQMWNGNLYLLQEEYDNHTKGCVSVGP
jgi:phosphate-induced protein 1